MVTVRYCRNNPPSGFYVYLLIDPRDKKPFYVGKGKAKRAWDHLKEVSRGRVQNQRKFDRIVAILADGYLGPIIEVVDTYDNQEDALAHEAELIASTPNLTNILARGGCWSITPEEAGRRLLDRAKAKRTKTYAARKQWLGEWLKKAEAWPGLTFPNLADGEAKAAEFMSLVRSLLSDPNILLPDIEP